MRLECGRSNVQSIEQPDQQPSDSRRIHVLGCDRKRSSMTTEIDWYQLEWGYRLHYPGGEDVIRITRLQTGTPGQIEFILRSAPVVTWAKRIYVRNDATVFGGTATADSNHGPNPGRRHAPR
jgi:hypothetical protein